MATPIPKLRTEKSTVSDREILLRLATNAEDARALQLLMDRHGWIVEEEVSYCFGRPPWFDSAVAAVLVEIVRRADQCAPQKHKTSQWIRKEARRAGRRLEQTIPDEHAAKGFIEIKLGAGNLEAHVAGLLERRRPSYWDDLRPRKPLRTPRPAPTLGKGES
jgi:hypothetical protein